MVKSGEEGRERGGTGGAGGTGEIEKGIYEVQLLRVGRKRYRETEGVSEKGQGKKKEKRQGKRVEREEKDIQKSDAYSK